MAARRQPSLSQFLATKAPTTGKPADAKTSTAARKPESASTASASGEKEISRKRQWDAPQQRRHTAQVSKSKGIEVRQVTQTHRHHSRTVY